MEGDAVGDDQLAKKLVGIGHDVGRVQQVIVRQVADRAPMLVGGEDAVPAGRLMEPLLDLAEGIAALDRVRAVTVAVAPASFARLGAGGFIPVGRREP